MATSAPASRSGTASDILDIAERLVQSRGFNGFSYADVSAELGITKAALHYHFAGKAEMGESLITRYTDRFGEALAAIDATDASPQTSSWPIATSTAARSGASGCACAGCWPPSTTPSASRCARL